MPEALVEIVKRVIKHGPTRVVINASGEATTAERAWAEHAIDPNTIYIRDDGWSLGCSSEFTEEACDLWKDKWVAVAVYAGDDLWYWRPYNENNEPWIEVTE